MIDRPPNFSPTHSLEWPRSNGIDANGGRNDAPRLSGCVPCDITSLLFGIAHGGPTGDWLLQNDNPSREGWVLALQLDAEDQGFGPVTLPALRHGGRGLRSVSTLSSSLR